MAKYVIEDTTLNNTANAIREKTGKTDKITPSNFATEIASIVSGGGSSIVTKGIVINEFDSDGYATDISVVGMTFIPKYYFYGGSKNTYNSVISKALKKIELPEELTGIGDGAFTLCTNLSLDKLPNSLTELGNNVFSECYLVAIKEIPSGITAIPNSAFYKCNKITELTAYGDLTSIGSSSFGYINNFSKLVLPNVTGVPTITTTSFNSTPIASGTGYIYVPDTLVDSFKSATNWSSYADQIKGISELEVSS